MEEKIDVLVIGGGAAGSAAALQLGRVRRSVAVVDSGEPRNAPAAHMQGYLGHDGVSPAEFTTIAHAELAPYGVTVVVGRVTSVVDDGDAMVCTTDGGDVYRARRVVLATGLTDRLPDIDGVRERWGDTVIHCPWCHGWEARDQNVVVIDTSGMGGHQALIFAQLSDRVTLVRNREPALTEVERERLELAGVVVEPRPATHITSDGDRMTIHLDGTTIDAEVAVVAPQFEPNVDMVDGLVDVRDHPSGLGRHVVVDDFAATSHAKIYAAGNVADPMQQVLHAAAHGSKAAIMLNTDLIDDDIERARHTANRVDWDERYQQNEQHWSGKPNGSLVVEASGLAQGRALDVGCGEGADAIWLAQQGWAVTGTDISEVAIGRARAAAESLDVDIGFVVADVSADSPPAGGPPPPPPPAGGGGGGRAREAPPPPPRRCRRRAVRGRSRARRGESGARP